MYYTHRVLRTRGTCLNDMVGRSGRDSGTQAIGAEAHQRQRVIGLVPSSQTYSSTPVLNPLLCFRTATVLKRAPVFVKRVDFKTRLGALKRLAVLNTGTVVPGLILTLSGRELKWARCEV